MSNTSRAIAKALKQMMPRPNQRVSGSGSRAPMKWSKVLHYTSFVNSVAQTAEERYLRRTGGMMMSRTKREVLGSRRARPRTTAKGRKIGRPPRPAGQPPIPRTRRKKRDSRGRISKTDSGRRGLADIKRIFFQVDRNRWTVVIGPTAELSQTPSLLEFGGTARKRSPAGRTYTIRHPARPYMRTALRRYQFIQRAIFADEFRKMFKSR